MALLLAVSVIILACGIIYTAIKNNELHHRVEGYKALHSAVLKKLGTAETKAREGAYHKIEAENNLILVEKIQGDFKYLNDNFWKLVDKQMIREKENLAGQMAVKLAPESHDVQQTDVEGLILNSPDPLWQFIAENRDLVKLWEQKRLDIVNTQPHYRYSEFATWLANFCEGHFNREDVQSAIEALEVVR